jgi:putative ABC transport system ATP-binding protein
MSALELRGVAHSYGDQPALEGVDLSVEAGELVALVGPSGSGKSTLLAVAGGLLRPSHGSVLIDGTDLYGAKEGDRAGLRREQIGFVFQSSNLLPFLDVVDNVVSPEVLRGRDRRVARTQAIELLAELGLKDVEKRRIDQLSGGERQRVGIARALIGGPSVVLADEPTASLDGARGRAVVQLLHEEVRRRHVAAVLVTHDERVLDLVDRVVPIADGRLGASHAA